MTTEKDGASGLAGRSLSVFLPCYNEAGNVERVVSAAVRVLEKMGAEYEVIVVDDGSGDGTGQIADRLASRNPRVRVVHHEVNKGYGAALQSGFKNASKELVFYTDGDGQFDFSEISGLLHWIDRFDIVVGCRRVRNDPYVRRLNAFLWNMLVQFLFGVKVRDIDCAFKLYRSVSVKDLDLESQGALIDTEVLVKVQRRGCTIHEVDVTHYPRTAGQQTGANVRVVLRAFRELFRLYWKLK